MADCYSLIPHRIMLAMFKSAVNKTGIRNIEWIIKSLLSNKIQVELNIRSLL